MAFVNTILKQGRHGATSGRRTGSVRPFAWVRHHGGAMTLPSQQAVDAISHSPDFPRH